MRSYAKLWATYVTLGHISIGIFLDFDGFLLTAQERKTSVKDNTKEYCIKLPQKGLI